MKRIFVELPLFHSRWKDLGLNDDDFRRLQDELLADPKVGAVMQGTGGIRKMRFASSTAAKAVVLALYILILKFMKKFI